MTNFLKAFKRCFIYAFFFSMLVNILQLTFSIYMLQVFDRVLTTFNASTLWVITAAAIIALGALALLEWIRSRLMAVVGIEFEKQMAPTVLEVNLENANSPDPDNSRGALRDVQQLRNFMGSPTVFAILDIPWIPIYLGMIFILHPLPGMVGVFGGIVALIIGYLTDRASRGPLQMANRVNAQSGIFLEAALRNASAVQSMGMNDNIANRWEKMNGFVVQQQTRASHKVGALHAINKSFSQILQVLIYCSGAYLAVTHQATAGIMIAASIIIGKALAPVNQAVGSYKALFEARASYNRLKELLDQPDMPDAMELPDPVGEIATENAAFSIQGRPIIKGISFRMPAGQSIALIGPSAAGKSTLCKLLLGIWAPTFGTVRLDGADLKTWDPDRLGRFVGYLPQDVELFHGTIAENIARMEEEPDMAAVTVAAHMAGVHNLIMSLPKGYETPIRGQGYILSGGQKQLIGLARALYGMPRLVVLDEPNSNLDEAGEIALVHAVRNLKRQGATVVLVTHKMNILSIVDNIMLMRDGQVMLCGGRDEVLQKMSEMREQARQQQMQQQQLQQEQQQRLAEHLRGQGRNPGEQPA